MPVVGRLQISFLLKAAQGQDSTHSHSIGIDQHVSGTVGHETDSCRYAERRAYPMYVGFSGRRHNVHADTHVTEYFRPLNLTSHELAVR